jgi:hypothetical protein
MKCRPLARTLYLSGEKKTMKTRSRNTLNPRLTGHLLAYAAGAVAASASLANAEVVYTPTHSKIDYSKYALDLNHDGINDFRLYSYNLSGIGKVAAYPLHAGNRIAATRQSCGNFPRTVAAALESGEVIGPHLKFSPKATCMVNESNYDGPWYMEQDRYLGLVFVIEGKEHYGWARITNLGAFYGATEILGYAYETEANQPIVAGDEGNSTEAFAPPATLGELALGAAARSAAKGKN